MFRQYSALRWLNSTPCSLLNFSSKPLSYAILCIIYKCLVLLRSSMILHIDHVTLVVRDVQKAKAFSDESAIADSQGIYHASRWRKGSAVTAFSLLGTTEWPGFEPQISN